VRALELTDADASLRPADSRLWSEHTRHPTRIFGLDVPPDVLEARIIDRADAMLAAGAVEEARRALAGEISVTERQMLGLTELATLAPDEALDALIVGTRQFAAYQRKWMRRIPGIELVDANRPPEQVAEDIATRLA
jgi:tRNA A37 N6-isopentenylltransferase MiaA